MTAAPVVVGRQAPDRVRLVLCMAAVWLLWGSVYLAIRLVVDEVDPFQAMAQRYTVAGLLLAGIAVARRGWGALRVTRVEALGLLATGVLLLGLGNGFQALAQVGGLPSGVAALIVATVPAWAVLIRLATGDRPPWATLLGVAIGFAGLVALVGLGQGTGEAVPLLAALFCLGASISWTLGSFLQGRLAVPDDIVTVAAYQQLVGRVRRRPWRWRPASNSARATPCAAGSRSPGWCWPARWSPSSPSRGCWPTCRSR